MNYERSGLLLPESTQKPRDASLHETLQTARTGSVEVYEELAPTSERKKQLESAFLDSDCTLDVDLRVDTETVSKEMLEARLSTLKEWKRDLLMDKDIDADIKQAYRWRINEDIAGINMVLASQAGDMNNFRRWNEFIYGKPDEAIYRAALDWFASDAETLLDSDNPTVAAAAAAVLAELSPKRGYRELLSPEDGTFQSVKKDHYEDGGYYSLLLDGTELPTTGKIKPEIGDPALERIIHHNLQSDYEIKDASSATWSVSHSQKAVLRPQAYDMPVKRFIGLPAGHELSHLIERVNGSRGPVRLAESGLDRTELGNEGRAVIREQVPYDSFDEFGRLLRWQDIMRRHIAIAYASGVGESTPKSFSETYRFVNLIDTMYQSAKTPDDSEAVRQKAHTRTWNLVTRVLKGTDGTGGAYLKDMVYLEGHVACWLTASLRGPEAISEGDLGKFDINNPRHIRLLQKLGLLPEDEEL